MPETMSKPLPPVAAKSTGATYVFDDVYISTPPPGVEATMMRIGFVGYCCADAAQAAIENRKTAAARRDVMFTG
jgi:hypothetical protein